MPLASRDRRLRTEREICATRPGGINVGIESGSCSGSSGIYVNGTVDVHSFTYNGSELGYSYAPYSGGSGTGVIGFGALGSGSDLSPFALEALPLAGSWASTGIRNAALGMALNGALVGVGGLIDMGAEALLTEEESAATDVSQVKFGSNANQAYHTFRHVEEAGIDTQAAENAIRNDLAGKGFSLPQGRTTGQVYVQGRVLQYNAYKFPDGTINVGRITVH